MNKQEIIVGIKAELRAMMNGVASAAMRDAGMNADYRVNFGVELPRLVQLADLLRSEHADQLPELAQALWHESVRECRILATMLYPPARFTPELAELWAEGIHTVELAQIAALHLFAQMPQASSQAFRWIAADADMQQIAGYYTLIHLVRRAPLSERSLDELRDQLATALRSDNPQLRLAAQRMANWVDANDLPS